MRLLSTLRLLPAALLLACAPALAQQPLHAGHAGGCDGFRWDVKRELALLAAPATELSAGDGRAAVAIQLGRHYRARLQPQAEVQLAARPDKPMLADDAMAGLLDFSVPSDGRYRVAITSSHWVDVIDAGKPVPTLEFQGRHGCPLVHKIVLFELKAGRSLQLQFSGGSAASVGVLVTPAPGAQTP